MWRLVSISLYQGGGGGGSATNLISRKWYFLVLEVNQLKHVGATTNSLNWGKGGGSKSHFSRGWEGSQA